MCQEGWREGSFFLQSFPAMNLTGEHRVGSSEEEEFEERKRRRLRRKRFSLPFSSSS
ncbi:hypothetical protein CSUI_004059 [Cystoisospora suis]|uniref:Uncharacterized protein n=1 Tax=Cystoisospora suis TaxID=483139 RepID=A0A2C6L056_9APIC|nr:hypothetical protein CSUI_004059 [Cystoisospora suis]